jgi:hypothetical protein
MFLQGIAFTGDSKKQHINSLLFPRDGGAVVSIDKCITLNVQEVKSDKISVLTG